MADYPGSVLVAVDFGEASASAVALGGAIAERGGATLRLLHAETFEAPAYFTTEQLDTLQAGQAESRRRAQQAVAAFGRRHTRYPFLVDVEDRPPVDAILQAAAAVDLLVLGTHGRRGPSRWWLGSVAERVLRETTTPLLVVHAGARDDSAGVFQRVVVDASPPLAGDRTLRYAEALARRFGGAVADRRGAPPRDIPDLPGTLVAIAAPTPRTAGWLSTAGEPLVRSCSRPVLFVPESLAGEPV
jgi:nucleotide-binding universal stress UspA family protein